MTHVFTKSGTRVRVLGPAPAYKNLPCVVAERLDTGKEMVVPVRGLVAEAEATPPAGCTG